MKTTNVTTLLNKQKIWFKCYPSCLHWVFMFQNSIMIKNHVHIVIEIQFLMYTNKKILAKLPFVVSWWFYLSNELTNKEWAHLRQENNKSLHGKTGRRILLLFPLFSVHTFTQEVNMSKICINTRVV